MGQKAGSMRGCTMYQEKLDYLIGVGRKIRIAHAALEITVKGGELRPLRSGKRLNPVTFALENKIKWLDDPKSKRREEKYTFQQAYNYLNSRDSELDDGVKALRADIELLKNPTPEIFSIIASTYNMLSEDFKFSDDSLEFRAELHRVTLVFALTKGEDQAVDFLAMRALFKAGQILEGLKNKGYLRSGKPFMAGSYKRKGYISDDEVIPAVKDAAKELKDEGARLSKRAIASRAQELLVAKEAEKKKPRHVFKEDHIRLKIISKEMWKEII